MRSLKFFSILIGFVGLYYLFHGIMGILFNFSSIPFHTISTVPPGAVFIVLLIFGILSIIVAFNLHKEKWWARDLWLGSCLTLVTTFVIVCFQDIGADFSRLTYFKQPAIAILITVISWVVLNIPVIKKGFDFSATHTQSALSDKNSTLATLKNSFIVWGIGVILLISLEMTFGTLSRPSTSKPIVLDQCKKIIPQTITTTRDHGFIVAGYLNTYKATKYSEKYRDDYKALPWVTKINVNGQVDWEYVDEDVDITREYNYTYYGTKPGYSFVEELPDESIFLFRAFNIITILDKKGKQLKQVKFNPEKYGIEKILTGIPIKEGFLLAGLSSIKNQGTSYQVPALRFPSQRYYDFFVLNKDGIATGENKINQSAELTIEDSHRKEPPIYSLHITTNDNVVFIMSSEEATDIVCLNQKGDVLAQSTISSGNSVKNDQSQQPRYIIARSANTDKTITLVSERTDPLIIISLNDALQEIRRVSKNIESGTITSAYIMMDSTLMLFGRRPNINERGSKGFRMYNPLIIKTDPFLHHLQTLTLKEMPDGKPVNMSYIAAMPLKKPWEFVAIRRIYEEYTTQDLETGIAIVDIVR